MNLKGFFQSLIFSSFLVFGSNVEGHPKRLSKNKLKGITCLEVKGIGIANQCPIIKGGALSFNLKPRKYHLKVLCLEPMAYFRGKVESYFKGGTPNFQPTKLVTRLNYIFNKIRGPLYVGVNRLLKFKEIYNIDYAATIVQLPRGKKVPFLFTIKDLLAIGKPDTFSRQILVLFFNDHGGSQVYDIAISIPSGDARDEEELAKENNKDITTVYRKMNFKIANCMY